MSDFSQSQLWVIFKYAFWNLILHISWCFLSHPSCKLMFPLDTSSCPRFTYVPAQAKIPTHTLLGLWVFLQGWKGCNFPVRWSFLFPFFFSFYGNIKLEKWIEMSLSKQSVQIAQKQNCLEISFFLETLWFLFLSGEFRGCVLTVPHKAMSGPWLT